VQPGAWLRHWPERVANLSYIYNYNDIEALQILPINRALFFALVKRLRGVDR
jgi:hypothetical protein